LWGRQPLVCTPQPLLIHRFVRTWCEWIVRVCTTNTTFFWLQNHPYIYAAMAERPELAQNIGRDVQVVRGPKGHLAFYGKHKVESPLSLRLTCFTASLGKHKVESPLSLRFTCFTASLGKHKVKSPQSLRFTCFTASLGKHKVESPLSLRFTCFTASLGKPSTHVLFNLATRSLSLAWSHFTASNLCPFHLTSLSSSLPQRCIHRNHLDSLHFT
jgi:hypothetical protein